MATPKQIAVYFGEFNSFAACETLPETFDGIHRYVRTHNTISLGPSPIHSVFLNHENLATWTGDGVIGFFYDQPLAESLLKRGIRVLNLTQHLTNMRLPTVVSDNLEIGHLAAAHLLERAYRHFVYFGIRDFIYSQERGEGFFKELGNRAIKPGQIRKIYDSAANWEQPGWFKHWYGTPEVPTGLFAADDGLALRILVAARADGMRIPKDLAIVGVNDCQLICESTDIPITSVGQSYGRVGFEAAQLLDRVLQGKQAGNTLIRVKPRGLTSRMSSQFFAFDDQLVEQALSYIHANIDRPFQVRDVVRDSGKSRRTLEMRFHKAIGFTLKDEIDRLRVERAKRLLLETDWTVSHVATACGYTAVPRFYEAFMRAEGATPKAFRER